MSGIEGGFKQQTPEEETLEKITKEAETVIDQTMEVIIAKNDGSAESMEMLSKATEIVENQEMLDDEKEEALVRLLEEFKNNKE
jgi:hypothetical protein